VLCIFYILWVPVYLVSSYTIIRPPRYRQSTRGKGHSASNASDLGHLCPRCQIVVGSSKVINGSGWRVIRSEELYKYYTRDELSRSALKCHLCNLFVCSMKVITGTSSEPDTTLSVQVRVVLSDLTQTEVSLHVWDQGNEASSCLLLDEVHRTEFSEQYKSSTDTSNSFTTKQAK
jgi:hypothetical protein